MGETLNYLYVGVVVVLFFGAAIFVHEFGHYWVALRRGLKVEAFAIGFGRKIFTWTRDGVEYSVRWIPAGGFVKLPQMQTSDALEGASGLADLPPASPWSKTLVALAGPLMNVGFAFAIATFIYFAGLPVPINPAIIGYVEPDSPEARLGIRPGDEIVAVNGKTVKSWHDVQLITALARTNIMPVVIQRGATQTTYQLAAKANERVGLKILNLDPRDHPAISEVKPGSAAEAAGLKPDDKILTFAGVPIVSREQLIELIKNRANESTEIQVERGGQKQTLNVTPRSDPGVKVGRIGVALTSSGTIVYHVQRPGPTPWAQIADVWDQTISTLAALIHSKQTGVGAKDLSGPVGILSVLAIQVNTDYRLALKFLVLLNVNLAIINLLPIPVLDGGHILMAAIEGIFRRRISARLAEFTTSAFAVLLISFMLYVTFFDIKRVPLFKSLLQRPGQIEPTHYKPVSHDQPSPAVAPAPAQP